MGRADRVSWLTTMAGHFTVVAADHRDSLRHWLEPVAPGAVAAAELENIKIDITAELWDLASGFMLDPEYGLGPVAAAGLVPADYGVIASLEAQGYFSDPDAGTSLLPGWGVRAAADAGAAAVKLLVLVDPVTGAASPAQLEVAADVIADCESVGVPLFLEPLAPTAAAEHRRRVAVTSARVLGALGPDVLKLPFPVDPIVEVDRLVWRDACAELDEAAGRPWTLLSGGGGCDLFEEQLAVAGEAGCSGFIVGRALWGDAVRLDRPARRRRLREVVRPRLGRLSATAAAHCRSIDQ